MGADFKATALAYQKFSQVLEDIETCKKLFEIAGEPLPEQLKEFFGSSRFHGRMVDAPTIAPPRRKGRPTDATDEWLSVELKEASATGLVLAVLRRSVKPMKAKEVVEVVTQLNPMIVRGSINNIGTRLDDKLINRDDEGWSLIDPNKAGIIYDGYLWGPKEIFEKTEIAAHRREAILTFLGAFPGGLQTVQIVDMLRNTRWMQAPASKDLVKADMELMEAQNKVRRISNSRKWCLRVD